MKPVGTSNQPTPSPKSSTVDDTFLIAGVARGDAAALVALMDRHDRLVRFTIFQRAKTRCTRDPQWVDSVASLAWEGFVAAVRRTPDDPPAAVKAFLVGIARNQTVSALRRESRALETVSIHDDNEDRATEQAEPSEIVARMELINAIRNCLGNLKPADQPLAAQLTAITERRWKEAAQALECPESTLRSRWKGLLLSLRECMDGKIDPQADSSPKSLAPGPSRSDNLGGG